MPRQAGVREEAGKEQGRDVEDAERRGRGRDRERDKEVGRERGRDAEAAGDLSAAGRELLARWVGCVCCFGAGWLSQP